MHTCDCVQAHAHMRTIEMGLKLQQGCWGGAACQRELHNPRCLLSLWLSFWTDIWKPSLSEPDPQHNSSEVRAGWCPDHRLSTEWLSSQYSLKSMNACMKEGLHPLLSEVKNAIWASCSLIAFMFLQLTLARLWAHLKWPAKGKDSYAHDLRRGSSEDQSLHAMPYVWPLPHCVLRSAGFPDQAGCQGNTTPPIVTSSLWCCTKCWYSRLQEIF